MNPPHLYTRSEAEVPEDPEAPERSGALRLIRNGETSSPISGLPDIAVAGQGGLLDVALANDFATSRTIFVSYSTRGDAGLGTAIARARLSEDGTALSDVQEIFRMNRFTGVGRHFGSRLAVAPDDTIYFTIGDRGESERAQDLDDHAGAVLRINADGTVPSGNPYAEGGGAAEEQHDQPPVHLLRGVHTRGARVHTNFSSNGVAEDEDPLAPRN